MPNTLLCLSQDDKKIVYDPVASHAAAHFNDTPRLREWVVELLTHRNVADTALQFDIDMGRIIGATDVVETDDTNGIVYAIRKHRYVQGLIPFTNSRSQTPSSYTSISLLSNADGSYGLSSAWIGTWDDPPFPREPHAALEDEEYWNTHAFMWSSQSNEKTPKHP